MIDLLKANPEGMWFLFILGLVVLGCTYYGFGRIIDAYTDIMVAKLTGKDPRREDDDE